MSLEIEYSDELKLALAPFGSARIEYITAETQPFSNQHRPDVVFSPFSGSYRDCIVFIELKLSTKASFLGHFVPAVLEKRSFAADALNRPVARYVYVSAEIIPEHSRKLLENEGIIVVAPATTVSDVILVLREQKIL